jgi:hypothetical protein
MGQTLLAVLAGGPYGAADKVGSMNRSLVMRSCRSDGVLLKADRPLLPIASTWTKSFDSLRPIHVWSTQSTVAVKTQWATGVHPEKNGAVQDLLQDRPTTQAVSASNSAAVSTATFNYIVSVQQRLPYAINVADLGVETTLSQNHSAAVRNALPRFVAYDYWHGIDGGSSSISSDYIISSGSLTPLDSDRFPHFMIPASPPSLNLRVLNHQYYIVAPVLANNWTFLGEPAKFVTASRRRISGIEIASSAVKSQGGMLGQMTASIVVSLRLAKAESVQLAFAPPSTVQALWASKPASAIGGERTRSAVAIVTCRPRPSAVYSNVATPSISEQDGDLDFQVGVTCTEAAPPATAACKCI